MAELVKWEYRTSAILDIDWLNRLGTDGWELVAILPPERRGYFKRPKVIAESVFYDAFES